TCDHTSRLTNTQFETCEAPARGGQSRSRRTMMNYLSQKKLGDHFEELGHRSMLECRDEAEAIRMCALYIQAYLAGLQSELARLASEIAENTNRHSALHDHLYNRAVPVDDAKM